MRVLELVQSENASVKQIAEVVTRDPAMSAKLLKLVNSPLFTRGRRIGSVDQALVLLGLRAVKVSLLGFSLTAALRQEADTGFDYAGYWRSSICFAVAARMLAQRIDQHHEDEAFVAGLLADVGQVAAHRAVPRVYDPTLAASRSSDRPLHELEAETLGYAHDTVGGKLLEKWGLPERMCQAVAGHHQPIDTESRVDGLSYVLRLAERVTSCLVGPGQACGLAELEALLAQHLVLSSQEAAGVLEEIIAHVPATADAFGLQITDLQTYAELQASALAQMTQLGVAAEAECTQAHEQASDAARRVDRMQQENQMLRRDAATDRLTRVGNRASFDEHLQASWSVAREQGAPLAIILLDIDHFKKLNDTYGHLAGDEVLRQIGQVLRQYRGETCFPARYGGEEFALIMNNLPPQEAERLAECVRRQIAAMTVEHLGRRLYVTASFGIAHTTSSTTTEGALDLLAQADQHLYEAKGTGRNRVVSAGP
jgi:diguanylate cyclase (GGDEF)-like protein